MRIIALSLFYALSLLCFGSGALADEIPSLNEQLAKRKSSSQAPEESRRIMDSALSSLEKSGILKRVPDVGSSLPDSTFLDANGEQVKLSELLKDTKGVITFYRGGWCPYCNLQLRFYQEHLDEITQRGGKLIAISPELPDNSMTTAEKNELTFAVLSDPKNRYAKKIGIVYELPANLVEVYKGFGIDLEKNQGSNTWELPLSATFVVDKDLKILYRFAKADYTQRAEITEIIKALDK